MIDSYTPPWFLRILRIQMLGPASAQGVEKSGVLCHIEIFARLRGPRAATCWNSPWRTDRRSTKGHGKFHGNDPTFELHNFFPHQKGEISTCRMTSVDFRGPRDLPWFTYVVDSHFKIQDMKNMQFNFNAKCSLSWIVAQFVMDMYQTNVFRQPKQSADSCSFPGSSLRQSSTASIAAAEHAKHGCVTWKTDQNTRMVLESQANT